MSVSSPAYTCSASADTATGFSSPRARSRSASATATAVLPTPVGPNSAMICIVVGSHFMQISGSTVLLTGATGGIGHAIARDAARARRQADPDGRRTDVLEPLAAELERARARGRSERCRRGRPSRGGGRRGRHPRRQRRAAGGRAPGVLSRWSEIDRALDVNLRAPIVLAHALAAGDGGTRAAGTCCSCPRSAGKSATPGTALYNATKFGTARLRLGPARRPARERRGRLRRLPRLHPRRWHVRRGWCQTPAWCRYGAAPRMSPARSSGRSSATAPRSTSPLLPCASGAIFAGLAPELAANVARRLGSEEIAHAVGSTQRDKR